MHNKFLNLFLAVGTVCLLSACKKNLDLKPLDNIDASKAYLKVQDLTDALYSVYAGNDNDTRIYNGSILADEVKLSDENRGQGQFQFKWQYNSSSTPAGLGQQYSMIDQIHRVLDAAPGIVAATPAEENTKKRIQSEMIALRGIAYYELLINFMPQGYDANALAVPLVLKSELLQKPARNTVGEIMTQIEADLATGRGEPLIPNAPTDPLRLSQAAIAAYQARAALLKKDWDKAITYSNDAVTLSGKTLSKADFPAYWTDDNESETILKYRNSTSPVGLWRDTNGDIFFEPADKLKNLFDKANDIRYTTYFTGIPGDDTSFVKKYPGSARGPRINDLKMIRLAEMYLIRAEAYAEKEQLGNAATNINALRAARITGYTDVAFASKDIAISQILTERYKELCFEGFRFFDLKRRNLSIDRNLSDSRSTSWQNLAANSNLFALPIPATEFSGNPNMVQNPGY
ncbi:MAG TPA: RagB/SusD family nutrient uptake outer membrane protein [Chitinophagaceae bacterium]|nr:RagB/SusD family nutrient uptake outer membrane protein [Chitinophagaceae bacterium]